MKARTRKTTKGRKQTVRKPVAPTITTRLTEQECTPIAQRSFIPSYTLADKAHGVRVTMEQGAIYCGGTSHGCDWCKAHGKDNHVEASSERVLLGVSLSEIVPRAKGTSGPANTDLWMDVSAGQLDALIAHLSTVRASLRDAGLLASSGGAR